MVAPRVVQADASGFFVCPHCTKSVHQSVAQCPHCGVRVQKAAEPIQQLVPRASPIAKDIRTAAAELHVELDALELDGKGDAARSRAAASGPAGATWLAKRTDGAEPNIEDILKSAEAFSSFMKRATNTVDKALGEFNARLAVYVESDPTKDINDFMESDAAVALKRRYDEARDVVLSGGAELIAKSHGTRVAALADEIEKEVEAFAIAHALDVGAAAEQLQRSSPTHVAKREQLRKASDAQREAAARAKALGERWRREDAERRQADARRDVEKQMEDRRRRTMSPSERRFDDRVGEIMKERDLSRPAATSWAIDNDPVAKSLYEVTREERATGSRS